MAGWGFNFHSVEWPIVSALTDALTALTTLILLLFVGVQLNHARRLQRASDANENVAKYFELAFENPAYAYPRVRPPIDRIERTMNGSAIEFERYEWFISIMLLACKTVLESKEAHNGWTRTMRRQIYYHWEYFRFMGLEDPDHWWWTFGPEVSAIIRELRATEVDPYLREAEAPPMGLSDDGLPKGLRLM